MMVHIINHQGNATLNHPEIPFPTHPRIAGVKTQQVLGGCGGSGTLACSWWA